MSKPIIEVHNISKKYHIGTREPYYSLRDSITGLIKKPFSFKTKNTTQNNSEFWALKDVSFQVMPGEVLGIIGRNGAGKSTLLKILSQITPPTKGEIVLRGRVASLLEVGTGFHPELTGRENIFLNGAILGMTRKEVKNKFDEIVDFAEIEKFLDTSVKHYSSGMYMRLAFAVAAHLEPEILLVDEVLAVGDTQFQKKCLGKMRDVAKQGRTVVLVSHNLTAITNLCQRAIVIEKGKVLTDNKTSLAIRKYLGNNKQHQYKKIWTNEKHATQNHAIVLKSVRICDKKGNDLHRVSTDTEFTIEIVYKVKENKSAVGLNLLFYDNENNLIFGTMNNLEKKCYGENMSQGIYKSICSIPTNFFNNGGYFINLITFGKNFTDATTFEELLKLEIEDGQTVRGDYNGEFGGVIRPLFEWRTVQI